MSLLAQNYDKIRERIKRAQKASSAKKLVRLLAVSKNQSLDKIRELSALGQKEFAENYLQELEAKVEALQEEGGGDFSWVFIGRLQSNKIKKIVKFCEEIQSLSSFEHARRIASSAKEYKKTPYPVYLLVNLGEESSKGGLLLEEVDSFAKQLEETLPELRIKGLMAIPPKVGLGEEASSAQKELYCELAKNAQFVGEGKLSIGMSSDLELAVSVGSDCVRIGTDLFGKRELS